LSEVETTIYEF